MVSGKMSICWSCGEDFILDPLAMQQSQPRCIDCHGEIVSDEIPISDAMRNYIDSKIGG
jgi:hypothetical protein